MRRYSLAHAAHVATGWFQQLRIRWLRSTWVRSSAALRSRQAAWAAPQARENQLLHGPDALSAQAADHSRLVSCGRARVVHAAHLGRTAPTRRTHHNLR